MRHPTGLESTAQLIARARAGDADAVDQLCKIHLRPLQRWASGRLPQWARDISDTDDLVQDTLIQTFRRIDQFDAQSPGVLQMYLRQAVMNRLRDELRKRARRPWAGQTGTDGIDPSPSPLDLAIGGEAVERYEQALAALDAGDREAIIGRLEMGYTYAELATVLGKPSAEAARKAARRSIVRLADVMSRARR